MSTACSDDTVFSPSVLKRPFEIHLMQQTIAATKPDASENWSETDRRMMTRALELAAEGVGQVSPGPLVGCVIVDESERISGAGFYLYDRVRHAETLAL